MTAMQDTQDLGVEGAGVEGAGVEGAAAQDAGVGDFGLEDSSVGDAGVGDEVSQLRAEVTRLRTLLVTENVGLSVGILMVHRRCGAREALAGLVELAMSSGRTMAQEADSLVARYDTRAPGAVDVSRPPPSV